MTNTSKLRALWAAIIAGSTAFIAYIANTPPEQQDALVEPIVALLPVTWRPTIGLVMRAISSVATVYAAVQASHSGPQTPPTNPPAQ